MSTIYEERVKKFGLPRTGRKYRCKVKGFHSGKILEAEMIKVNESDVDWRFEDGAEFDERNWNVIEWVEIK